MSRFAHRLAYGVGMAFSASCFTALGMLVQHGGRHALVALCASFLLMLVVIAAVSELASLFPSAVGLRTYTKVGIGEFASLMAVVLYLCLVVLVAGIEMRMFLAVATHVWPRLPPWETTVGVFAVVVAAHLCGWRTAAWVQTGLVLLLVVSVVFLAGANFSTAPMEIQSLPALDFASAIVVGLFLFASVEWITTLQVRNLQDAQGVPWVLLAACALLALLFMCLVAALVQMRERGQAVDLFIPQRAMTNVWSEPWASAALVSITALAMLSTFHAGLACGSRLIHMLSREGFLPSGLGRTNAAGTPVAAIAAVALTCLLGVGLVQRLPSLEGLAEAGALAISSVYVMYLVSAARLRATTRKRAWRTTLLPRWLLWFVATLLTGVMAVTCWEAHRQSRLGLALLPWMVAAVAVGLMRIRQLRTRAQALTAKPLIASEQNT